MLFAVMLAFSGICDAAITFQANGGQNFILSDNNVTRYGKYLVTRQNGEFLFTFNYNTNTQEFTLYNKDGSKFAVRKMLDRNRMMNKEYAGFPDGIYTNRNDGYYYSNSDGRFRIYDR